MFIRFLELKKKLIMLIAEFCSNYDTADKRRHKFHQRKLEMLKFYRDSIERRLASLNASIDTLETQINRDSMD